MGFNWIQVLGAGVVDFAVDYDEQASDVLCLDRPRSVPPGMPVDPGDDVIALPVSEDSAVEHGLLRTTPRILADDRAPHVH
ncbi:MAG: hypothetical protein L0G99_13275 [Propionibacteriales bacterium]|nr:hypothetical protein [Propionibacteriales bacterium]